MTTNDDAADHVIINLDDSWYKVPLEAMEGYRVEPHETGLDLGSDDEVAGFGFEPPRSPDVAGFPGDSLTPGRAFPGDSLNPGLSFPGDSLSPAPSYRRGSAFFPGS